VIPGREADVRSLLVLAPRFVGVLLTASRIPFYGVFKCIFFLWLALPQTEVRRIERTLRGCANNTEAVLCRPCCLPQGSTLIFNQFLAPTFAEHEDDIDAFLGGLRVKAGKGFVGVWGWLWAKVREQVRWFLLRCLCGVRSLSV
jgi:hypothetical protein